MIGTLEMPARKHVPEIRPSKQAAAHHVARLEKLERRLQDGHENELKQRYNGMGEAEVVLGEQLSAVIKKWIVDWYAERDELEITQGRVLGPIEFIKEHTVIHVRRIYGIANGEFKIVPLSQADAILQAIGKPDLLGTGEIMVIPNPNWSFEKWMNYMRERGCI